MDQYLKFINALRVILMTSTLIASMRVQSASVFKDGFETGKFDNFSPQLTSGATFKVVNSPVATGKYSGQLSLSYAPGGDNYRAEAVLKNGYGDFAFDKEYWVRFKFYYKDWKKDSLGEAAPFQIHNRYQTWGSCQWGAALSTAPFLMFSQNDVVSFRTFGGKVRWQTTIPKGKWLEMKVHFKISTTSAGFVEAWYNGQKIFRTTGINSYATDKCGTRLLAPYFKFGIYKFPWKTQLGESQLRTLVFDDIETGTGTQP
jgi:hypothetical protein